MTDDTLTGPDDDLVVTDEEQEAQLDKAAEQLARAFGWPRDYAARWIRQALVDLTNATRSQPASSTERSAERS